LEQLILARLITAIGAYSIVRTVIRQYSICQAWIPLFCSGHLPRTVTDNDSLASLI